MHNIPLLLTSQAGAECHAHQCSIICSGQCAVGRLLGGESPMCMMSQYMHTGEECAVLCGRCSYCITGALAW